MEFLDTIRNRFERLLKVYTTLSGEKVLIVWGLLLATVLLWCAAIIAFNARYVIEVPGLGGTLSEGIVGTPRYINPVLASSAQDLDLAALIYAGLTKRDATGNYIPDMASSVIMSEDGLHYDITLKPSARFHDGEKVTADDVIFTIAQVQDPRIKSPHFIEWEGVTVDKVSDTELSFSLKKPYPLFMETLSLGIVPKHLWKTLSEEQFGLSDYNIHPIGSGPFMIDSVDTSAGIPQTYNLKEHKYYTLGRPYIDALVVHLYGSEKALITAYNNGDIDRMSGLAANELSLVNNLAKSKISTSRLPRAFTIFLNPNKAEFLSDKNVRKALSIALDRGAIVDQIYKGYAVSLGTPYPFDENQGDVEPSLDQARLLLSKSKYMKKASSTLSVTLTTTNSDELRAVADQVQKSWNAIGVQTQVLVYEPSDVNQTVIKERDFQTLLFGTLVSHPSDLYAFWHSSQRSYPGLNISSYISQKLDKALTTLRESEDKGARDSAYDDVKMEFEDETPGIFLYSPMLVYVQKDNATTPLPASLTDASDRFALVHTWYVNKEKVWKGTYYPRTISILQNIIH
jgi:peptide/nickel transport system substrate-binding protein